MTVVNHRQIVFKLVISK